MTELGINGQEFSLIGGQQGTAGSAVLLDMKSRIGHDLATYGVRFK
jgi:hypothetical protein